MEVNRSEINIIIAILTLTLFKYFSPNQKLLSTLVVVYILKNKRKREVKILFIGFLILVIIIGQYYNEIHILNEHYSNISAVMVAILMMLLLKIPLNNLRDKGDIARYKKVKLVYTGIVLILGAFVAIMLYKIFNIK